MNLRRLVFFLLPAIAGLLLGGCASFHRGAEDVAVSLADLRPLEASAFESRLVLTVRVTNAGPEALRLSGSRHRLVVNGHALGVAVSSEALDLPGLSTATQEVAFNLSHMALLPLANELRREPVAVYQIESRLFGGGWLSRGMNVRQSGTIDLSALAGLPGSGAVR